MIDLNREEFENMPEVHKKLKDLHPTIVWFSDQENEYTSSFDGFQNMVIWLNGAWYAFQKQQKKLDCCREEYKAHLEKIDELKARIDVYELHIKTLKNIHENDFNEESESIYILGNLDGFFECIEADLKGNKDEN